MRMPAPSLVLTWLFGVNLAGPMRAFANAKSDHDALRKVRQVYEDAMNSGDLEKLRPYLAADYVHVAATGDVMQGMDGVMRFWQSIKNQIGKDATYHVHVEPDLSDLYGDVAIAHGSAKEEISTTALGTIDFDTKWIAVFSRENGSWKAVRSQATINSFQNPVINLLVKKARWIFGSGGLAVGLVLGFLMGRRPKTA